MKAKISKRNARSIRRGIMKAKSIIWFGPAYYWMLTTKDKLAYKAYSRYERKYMDLMRRRDTDPFTGRY